jgi:hypothetical protein
VVSLSSYYLLPDREVRRLGAGLTALSLRILLASAVGGGIGGPIGDRSPEIRIWGSIVGALPSLALPMSTA